MSGPPQTEPEVRVSATPLTAVGASRRVWDVRLSPAANFPGASDVYVRVSVAPFDEYGNRLDQNDPREAIAEAKRALAAALGASWRLSDRPSTHRKPG